MCEIYGVTEDNGSKTIGVVVNCVIVDGRVIRKYKDGLEEEHCVHGIKLRWSCDECEEIVEKHG